MDKNIKNKFKRDSIEKREEPSSLQKKVDIAYSSLRNKIGFLLNTFKNIYLIEKQKGFSNSLIFIKRNVEKISSSERLISNVKIDEAMLKTSSNKDKVLVGQYKDLYRETLKNINLLKENQINLYNSKYKEANDSTKSVIKNNLDCLSLALKNLRFIDINMNLSNREWDELEKKVSDTKEKL